jgi:hypothetical protein
MEKVCCDRRRVILGWKSNVYTYLEKLADILLYVEKEIDNFCMENCCFRIVNMKYCSIVLEYNIKVILCTAKSANIDVFYWSGN